MPSIEYRHLLNSKRRIPLTPKDTKKLIEWLLNKGYTLEQISKSTSRTVEDLQRCLNHK